MTDFGFLKRLNFGKSMSDSAWNLDRVRWHDERIFWGEWVS